MRRRLPPAGIDRAGLFGRRELGLAGLAGSEPAEEPGDEAFARARGFERGPPLRAQARERCIAPARRDVTPERVIPPAQFYRQSSGRIPF